jgi:fructoselysine and glucoselysine-specific PTS system IIB component
MIELLRVDHRLLHGQVAVTWTAAVRADCIFIVGDKVANDEVWRTTLKLGKPRGCKLVIKDMAHAIEAINSGVTDKYHMIICVQTIADAKQLVEGCPQITSINLGNTKETPTTKEVTRQIFLEETDIEMLRDLTARGIELEYRALADDPKVNVARLI